MHEELVKRLDVLRAFLNGEGPLNGHEFGERLETGAKFWWRAEMRAVFAEVRRALTAPQAETCEVMDGSGADRDKNLGLCMAPNCWARATEWYVAGVYRRDCCEGHRLWCFRELDKLNAQDDPRPWKRKDGTTTPERGDVVDRRHEGGTDVASFEHRRKFGLYGRRSGDYARWTAPVQETSQTWVEWFDANNVDMTLRKLCAELDRRSAMK